MRIEANCFGIVAYRFIVFIFISVRTPSIVVDIGIVWVQSNRLSEILDCSAIVPLLVIGDSSIVVGIGIIWFYANHLSVVVDRLIVVLRCSIGVSTSIHPCLLKYSRMLLITFERFIKMSLYSGFMVRST